MSQAVGRGGILTHALFRPCGHSLFVGVAQISMGVGTSAQLSVSPTSPLGEHAIERTAKFSEVSVFGRNLE